MRTTWYAITGGGVVLLIAGGVLNTQELSLLGAAALACCLYAFVFTRRHIRLVVDRAVEPDRVTVGEPASLIVAVTNPERQSSPAVVGRHDTASGSQEFLVPPLRPGASDQWALALDTSRRGAYELGPVELVRTDPLRLLARSKTYGETTTFLVLPRCHRIPMLSASSQKGDAGVRADRSAHGSEAFHALREYVVGDDQRLIHWRSSARTGELVVKQFVDLWQAEVLLLIDTRAESFTGDRFEDCIEAAASIAAAATEARNSVTILLGSGEMAAARPGTGLQRSLLDLLARAECAEGVELRSLARRITSGGTHRAVVLLTGAPPDEEVLSFLAATGPFQRRIVVRFTPDLEQSPLLEMSRFGDEAISTDDLRGFIDGWSRLVS